MFLETAVSSGIQGWRPPWARSGSRRSRRSREEPRGAERSRAEPSRAEAVRRGFGLLMGLPLTGLPAQAHPCALGLLPSATLLSSSHARPAELGSVTTGSGPSGIWPLAAYPVCLSEHIPGFIYPGALPS